MRRSEKLRELAHRRRLPFKEVVNAVIRRGLAAQDRRAEPGSPFRVEVFESHVDPEPRQAPERGEGMPLERLVGEAGAYG